MWIIWRSYIESNWYISLVRWVAATLNSLCFYICISSSQLSVFSYMYTKNALSGGIGFVDQECSPVDGTWTYSEKHLNHTKSRNITYLYYAFTSKTCFVRSISVINNNQQLPLNRKCLNIFVYQKCLSIHLDIIILGIQATIYITLELITDN